MPYVVMHKFDVTDWTAKDFVNYYMFKYRELTHNPDYKFPDKAWLMYGIHVKRFLKEGKITKDDYRKFIDYVFSSDFLESGRFPGIMAIVNKQVFYYFKKKEVGSETDDDIEALKKIKAQFFSSVMIFPKL